jgi:hypothetical protein
MQLVTINTFKWHNYFLSGHDSICCLLKHTVQLQLGNHKLLSEIVLKNPVNTNRMWTLCDLPYMWKQDNLFCKQRKELALGCVHYESKMEAIQMLTINAQQFFSESVIQKYTT